MFGEGLFEAMEPALSQAGFFGSLGEGCLFLEGKRCPRASVMSVPGGKEWQRSGYSVRA